MKKSLLTILSCALGISAFAAEIVLTAPLDYKVIQRTSPSEGVVRIQGKIRDLPTEGCALEARMEAEGQEGDWKRLTVRFERNAFDAEIKVVAGGWYGLEVRAVAGGEPVARTRIDHVGVGEVFVIAGQSNSANHGEACQKTSTGRVATFDGASWRIADDPQPGASGKGGSFMPPLGDILADRFHVPIGFVACGIGATSVREWLPKGATFPNPPTIETRVERTALGDWASKGEAYDGFVSRIQPLGVRGFRAVLWHQGESDANQADPTRTLEGSLYRDYLERIIRDSRHDIHWDAPWFVAQVSYHGPGDEASPAIRAAQGSLWKDGVAMEGPDSDSLKGDLRERNGRGVHFSDKGLREHAALWAAKVAPWLESELIRSSR